ncbi:MAG: anti-sigma factor antagonist [Lachnospiraceae bacterium]|nr:anti-sigma factor antagonist [Lachnospiraceae bacterium]
MSNELQSETTYRRYRDVLVIGLPPEVDHHSSQGMKETAGTYIKNGHVRYVIFDFKNTSFMDSAGIGMLLGQYKLMNAVHGSVAVCSVDRRINRILDMSGIYQIARRYESIEEALSGREN